MVVKHYVMSVNDICHLSGCSTVSLFVNLSVWYFNLSWLSILILIQLLVAMWPASWQPQLFCYSTEHSWRKQAVVHLVRLVTFVFYPLVLSFHHLMYFVCYCKWTSFWHVYVLERYNICMVRCDAQREWHVTGSALSWRIVLSRCDVITIMLW
jgi:hypothetical protein